ncbi:unnamed protein product [Staurois parvus]|uniref:Uncharacterized protein n=1 Tax=Staurois parvus TaxID=386267 RepID=A0ABN9DDU3_9NEOB|nr:unnamed protein product [Staurois parvus]
MEDPESPRGAESSRGEEEECGGGVVSRGMEGVLLGGDIVRRGGVLSHWGGSSEGGVVTLGGSVGGEVL